MAYIKLGSASQYEMMEIRDKLVDGLNAAKQAMKYVIYFIFLPTINQGILPGGGTSLLRASKLLNHVHLDNKDQQ